MPNSKIPLARRRPLALAAITCSTLLFGCATQTHPPLKREAPQPLAEQKAAQQAVLERAPETPVLKRKIALGRISNETRYGQSLLRDQQGDPLGKQVTDLLSKALTESGAFLVFERPDISRLQSESALTGKELNLVGVDALVIGSLTEFGRKVVGERGFLSDSKRQVAFAKVDLRLVDVSSGLTFFATSGAGEASTETSATLGFGSQAGFDGTLNDAALRQAVSEAVNRLAGELGKRPWQTSVLRADSNTIYIGGGKSQGIRPGMMFAVYTQGEKVKSPQTGATVQLPGRRLGELRIDSTFGDDELSEGSVATLVSGSLGASAPQDLVVRFEGAVQ